MQIVYLRNALGSLAPTAAFGVLIAVATGCSQPDSIEVEPAKIRLTRPGQEIQLKAVVKDSSGKALDVKPSFTSMTATIIKVDPGSGRVTAVRSGDGQVLVQAGDVSKKVPVSVQIPKKVSIEPSEMLLNVGVSKGVRAVIYNDQGKAMLTTGRVRWASSDPSVVSVDRDGNIKTLKEGKATLTAHAAGIKGSTTVTVQHEKFDSKEGVWK